MTVGKVLSRLAAFFAAFAAAASLVALLAPAPSRRAARVTRPAAARARALSENVETKVELVSLDREQGRAHARLRLRLLGGPPPARLLVRTYFFNADGPGRRVWTGDPVEVRDPFARGDSVSLNVAADCGWCADEDAPRGGYFARVRVSADEGESELQAGESFFDIKTAAPVVVHVERPATNGRR